ncbi:MAG: sulfur carrier protein ThiS adenylyltransferase ThiF [Campylobacter sp.]
MIKIIINGTEFDVLATNLDELKDEIFKNKSSKIYKFLANFNIFEPDIVIVDGFAASENLTLKNGSNIVFIRRGAMPEREILKAMIASRNSPEMNEILQNACIGVAGLGGLGSNIVLSLARLGVAKLVIADFDVVEPSNLNRQQYLISHIGMKKSHALKSLVAQINPFVEIVDYDVFLDASNVAEIFKDCQIICEAFDSVASKVMIVNEAGASLKDKRIISASGMAGFYSSNSIKTIKFARNVYLCGDLQNSAKVGQGLMAPRVAICANHQANLAVRLLAGFDIED